LLMLRVRREAVGALPIGCSNWAVRPAYDVRVSWTTNRAGKLGTSQKYCRSRQICRPSHENNVRSEVRVMYVFYNTGKLKALSKRFEIIFDPYYWKARMRFCAA